MTLKKHQIIGIKNQVTCLNRQVSLTKKQKNGK